MISVLIKPASSACNLRCRYCFYADVSENREVASYGIMNEETVRLTAQRIDEALEHEGTANISFQGGEPTVAGLDFFRMFISVMKEYPGITVHYSIQTNGTLIDREWAEFFHENHFLTGVSLDGYQANMDAFRFDPMHKGVYYKVLAGIDALKKANAEYNILTVITADLGRHPKALFDFFRSHKFEYVQLIPCLPGLNETDDMALTPELYRSFMTEFFDCWYKAVQKGVRMEVNLFENLLGMLQGQPPYQCGMIGRCFVQYVIESNGDVYPCDFYCLDEYRLGNLRDSSFRQLAESGQAAYFLEGSECRKAPCADCPFVDICSGGCRRQNVCYLNDEMCGYRKVLEHVLPKLDRMLQRYRYSQNMK